jgi:hypothetical protein
MADHEDYLSGEAPMAHGPSHELLGSDQISVAGLSGVTEELADHILLPDVHHARYTDVEAQIVADAEIGIHAAIPTAHQNAPALIGVHAALPTVHQDAPALIATHKADASAHHAKYTDAEARAALSPISIPGAAFVPKLDTYDWIIDDLFIRNRAALTLQEFFAPVSLPNGATITSVTLYAYRDDALSSLQLYLRRITHVAAHTILASCLADWTDGYGDISDSTIDTPIVNNADYGYVLELRLEPNNNVYDCWLVCAKIEFTG